MQGTKTFSILGDSISTFEGYIPETHAVFYPRDGYDVVSVEQTWWRLLERQTGLRMLVNDSYSGSRISKTGYNPPWSAFIDERRQAALRGDIIIVFGGTNDFGQEWNPAPLSVFEDAYRQLVDLMAKRHPSSDLYFCTPLQRTDFTLLEPNKRGWTQTDLANTIQKRISETQNRNVHLIDLARQPIEQGDGMLQDGVHPTFAGMEMLSTLMQKGLGY